MGQNCSCLDGLSRDGRRPAIANARTSEERPLLQNAVPQGAHSCTTTCGDGVKTAPANGVIVSCNEEPMYSQKAPPALHSEETSSQDDDQEPSPEKLSAPIAELGPDGLPSVGSAGHFAGECKRCAFFPKARCQNGHACAFCHFDHEKNKRAAKKKRGNGSAPPTPSGTNGNAGSLLYSPLGHHPGFSGTPSPAGASPVSPSVAMLAPAEMPPPPDEDSQMVDVSAIPAATTAGVGEGSVIADHPVLASAPLSWSENVAAPVMAAPAGVMGERVTIDELLSGTQTGVPLAEDQQQLWQQLRQQEEQYWAHADQWAFYNDYYQQTQEYLTASMMYDSATAAMPSQSPADLVPNAEAAGGTATPLLTLPSSHGAAVLGTSAVAPSAGVGNDSPRTLILAMCGAWGALSVPALPGEPRNDLLAADLLAATPPADLAPELAPPLSREVLLGYRAMYKKLSPPDAMKSMRMTADDPKRVAPKRGVKSGQRRGRAS